MQSQVHRWQDVFCMNWDLFAVVSGLGFRGFRLYEK